MPTTVRWHDTAQSILMYEMSDNWTTAEFLVMYENAMRMIEAVPDVMVDAIVYRENKGTNYALPHGFLQSLPAMMARLPRNTGIVVLTVDGQPLYTRTLATIASSASSAFRARVRVAGTLREAEQCIARYRALQATLQREVQR